MPPKGAVKKKMNSYTLKLDNRQMAELKKQLSTDLIAVNNEHIAFAARLLNGRITAYKSGSVLFQGRDAQTLYLTFHKQFCGVFSDAAGSDEVGTGDYFWPIVVCACFICEQTYPAIQNLGLTDSKALSDSIIRQLGPRLYDLLPNSLLVLNNQKYNEIQPTNNMNAIKAKLHNQAYFNLRRKIGKLPALTVIDQFTPPVKYFQYLKDEENVVTDVLFSVKAESQYPAVAAASIIARFRFLREIDKLKAKYHFPFPLGAGTKVDEALLAFVQSHPGRLNEVAKLNFRNTKKVGVNL